MSAHSQECISTMNAADKEWGSAVNQQEQYALELNAFLKSSEQTCGELVNFINRSIDIQDIYLAAVEKYKIAESKHCKKEKAKSLIKSAQIKQSLIAVDVKDLDMIYEQLKNEAIRLYCIKG